MYKSFCEKFDEKNVEYFLNLTTGLEWAKLLSERKYRFFKQFIRIQSTHCEQKLYELILLGLDDNFLMKLAIGKHCVVFDCTSAKRKNNTSRACWQGLSWIRYSLERCWFGREIELDHGMHKYFEIQYNALDRKTKGKLRYYKKFLMCDQVLLGYGCEPTDHDGDCQFYKDIVKKFLLTNDSY